VSSRVVPVSFLGFAALLAACADPTFDEKCEEHCVETLNECGAEIDCSGGCEKYGGGEGCDAELERNLDCALALIDDFDDEERELMCRGDGSAAVLFESCQDEVDAYLACIE
jgi:hypothetical protein